MNLTNLANLANIANIAIVSIGDDNVSKERSISFPLWENYALKYNYKTFLYLFNITDRAPGWSKIKIILNHLNDFDYILWVDYDAFPTNDFLIEDMIDSENELFITKDINGINSGVFVVKCCQNIENFLNEVWVTNIKNTLNEQGSMGSLLNRVQVKYLDRHLYNAYPYDKDEPLNWDVDSKIAHCAGWIKNYPKWVGMQKVLDFKNRIWRDYDINGINGYRK